MAFALTRTRLRHESKAGAAPDRDLIWLGLVAFIGLNRVVRGWWLLMSGRQPRSRRH